MELPVSLTMLAITNVPVLMVILEQIVEHVSAIHLFYFLRTNINHNEKKACNIFLIRLVCQCFTDLYLFNGNVRLTGGATSGDGFAEVFYNGSWRGICDDDFGLVDGGVICRQLGYVGIANYKCCSNFGTYSGKYWLNIYMFTLLLAFKSKFS